MKRLMFLRRSPERIRRIAATVALTGMLSVIFTGFFGQVSVIADTEKTGYWKFTDMEIDGPDSNFDGSTMSGGDGHYECSATCEEDFYLENHKGTCRGETCHITIDVERPPQVIEPGQEVALKVNASFSASTPHDGMLFYTCKVYCNMGKNQYHNGEIPFKNSDGVESLGIDRTWSSNDYYGYGGQFFVIEGDQVLKATAPDGSEGQTMWILQNFGHGRGEDMITTYYNYEWVDTTPVATATPEPTVEPAATDPSETEPLPTEITPTPTEEAEDDRKVDIVVDSEASKEEGSQDAGFIPSGIVNGWKKVKDLIGVLGGAAAAIAGGALGLASLSDGESESEEEQTTYRMAVYKEFGDTINRGEEVVVYACIMENDPSMGERVNHKLTSQISILSEDETFDVTEQEALAGDYKAARVITNDDKGSYAMEGAVSFKFTGKGGSFTNRMKFKIAGADIFFGQENIALPHDLNEPMKPWFIITGMGNKPDINAEITPEGVYNVNITEAESTGISGVWAYYANIIPITGAPSMEDREPGAVEVYNLHVVAEGDDKQQVEADLDVIRVRTGLTLTTKHVDCFWNKTTNMQVFEEKDGGDGTKWFKTTYTSPVMTDAELKLIVFDLEEHVVRVVAPLPVKEGTGFYSNDEDEQNIINRLGIVI
nr:hypothetical protein [Lachnospiraceae bacterium]